ncbi:MAG: phenylacetate--CoA ligase family protein [Dethiobacter sp.]|nr:MAG: phenylacetate--CoA ligase family protein [Dethiobacter sp.]
MKYNDTMETMPQKDLQKLQLEKFKKQVNHVYKNKFFKSVFEQENFHPEKIRYWEDIKQVPFTYKKYLRDNYPLGLLSGNWDDVVRVHMTSGTTGIPTPMVYTKNDLDTWSECLARGLIAAGLKPGDIVQQSHGIGLFTGGFGFHYGLERMGAKIIPTGSGGTERQLRLMKEWGVTAFVSTPSYAVYVAETALEKGIDLVSELKLRIGFHGAEPCSEELRKRINKLFGYKEHGEGGGVKVTYGLTEMGGPISMECAHENGIHIWADHYLVEVIDPDSLNDVEPGQPGELVISNLSFEAMPLIRYRTGDRVIVDFETCICGRTHPRITKFLGRVDDMILVSGTNVFPSQVEYVLLKHDKLSENWQLIVGEKKGLHTLKVEVEPVPGTEIDDNYVANIEKELHSYLLIKCKVEIKPVGSLPRFEGKAKRVIDKRQDSV